MEIFGEEIMNVQNETLRAVRTTRETKEWQLKQFDKALKPSERAKIEADIRKASEEEKRLLQGVKD